MNSGAGFIKRHFKRRGSLQSGIFVPLTACRLFTPEAVSVQLSSSLHYCRMERGGKKGHGVQSQQQSQTKRQRRPCCGLFFLCILLSLIACKHIFRVPLIVNPLWWADGIWSVVWWRQNGIRMKLLSNRLKLDPWSWQEVKKVLTLGRSHVWRYLNNIQCEIEHCLACIILWYS